MVKNIFGNNINGNVFGFGLEGTKNSGKRTLGIRDKQILYERAGKKCESCGKSLEFSEMQSGHKTAASKGGNATFQNSVCLCYSCNKLQGTDSWATFMRKKGISKTETVTSVKKTKPRPKTTSNKKPTKTKKSTMTKKKTKKEKVDAFGLPVIKIPEIKMPKFKSF